MAKKKRRRRRIANKSDGAETEKDKTHRVHVAVVGDQIIDSIHLTSELSDSDPVEVGATSAQNLQLETVYFSGGAKFVANFVETALREVLEPDEFYLSAPPDPTDDKDPRYQHLLRFETKWEMQVLPRLADRFRLTRPRTLPRPHEEYAVAFPEIETDVDILVFDDLGISFRTIPPKTEPPKADDHKSVDAITKQFQGFIERLSAQAAGAGSNAAPLIIAALGAAPPDLKSGIWDLIHRTRTMRERTIVVANAEDLRRYGLNVSTALSWERTAQDFVAELYTHPHFRRFSFFRHLIVRFGVTGAVHICREEKSVSHELLFFPDSYDAAFTDPDNDGVVIGLNSVFVASLVRCIAERQSAGGLQITSLFKLVDKSLHDALRRCRKLYEHGYGKTSAELRLLEHHKFVPPGLFKDLDFEDCMKEPDSHDWIAAASIPCTRDPRWSILAESTRFNFDSLAESIVWRGPRSVLTQPPRRVNDECCRQLVQVLESALPLERTINISDLLDLQINELTPVDTEKKVSVSEEIKLQVLKAFGLTRESVAGRLQTKRLMKSSGSLGRRLSNSDAVTMSTR